LFSPPQPRTGEVKAIGTKAKYLLHLHFPFPSDPPKIPQKSPSFPRTSYCRVPTLLTQSGRAGKRSAPGKTEGPHAAGYRRAGAIVSPPGVCRALPYEQRCDARARGRTRRARGIWTGRAFRLAGRAAGVYGAGAGHHTRPTAQKKVKIGVSRLQLRLTPLTLSPSTSSGQASPARGKGLTLRRDVIASAAKQSLSCRRLLRRSRSSQ